MSTIGFIGTGHIAAPMARHLAAKGHDILVSPRNAETAAALAGTIGARILPNDQVVAAADTVFLCLRPHLAVDAIRGLPFREGQKIVSVMAGIAMEQLRDLCAPATEIAITIPLGFLEHGGCPLACLGAHDMLGALFAPENPVVPVAGEEALNAHFAICTMVPGILDLMATGAGWLGERTGNADAAEFYTAQLVAGYLHAMEKGAAGRIAAERDSLATEGTISLQMTDALKAGGAHDQLSGTLDAIGARLSASS